MFGALGDIATNSQWEQTTTNQLPFETSKRVLSYKGRIDPDSLFVALPIGNIQWKGADYFLRCPMKNKAVQVSGDIETIKKQFKILASELYGIRNAYPMTDRHLSAFPDYTDAEMKQWIGVSALEDHPSLRLAILHLTGADVWNPTILGYVRDTPSVNLAFWSDNIPDTELVTHVTVTKAGYQDNNILTLKNDASFVPTIRCCQTRHRVKNVSIRAT